MARQRNLVQGRGCQGAFACAQQLQSCYLLYLLDISFRSVREASRFTSSCTLQLRIKDMKAVLEYPKEEESEEVDLTDLMNDGHIALSKSMHVMKRFTRNLAGCEPALLLGHLQPQPHLLGPTSMLTNSLPRVLPLTIPHLTVPVYTSKLPSQLTVFAM